MATYNNDGDVSFVFLSAMGRGGIEIRHGEGFPGELRGAVAGQDRVGGRLQGIGDIDGVPDAFDVDDTGEQAGRPVHQRRGHPRFPIALQSRTEPGIEDRIVLQRANSVEYGSPGALVLENEPGVLDNSIETIGIATERCMRTLAGAGATVDDQGRNSHGIRQ